MFRVQCQAFLGLLKASLISTCRNPSSLVFGFLFPLVFILVFGVMGEHPTKLNVGVISPGPTGNAVMHALGESKAIRLLTLLPVTKMRAELKAGRIAALVSVRFSESGKASVQLITSSAAPEQGEIVRQIVGGLVTKVNFSTAKITPVVGFKSAEVVGRPFKSIDFVLPGQLGFALLTTAVFGTSFLFIMLRQTLVMKRFFTTPVSRFTILAAEGGSRLIFGIFQTALMLFIGVGFLGFTVIDGGITVLSMMVLSILGLTVFMGLGFIIASVASDEKAIPPLANLFTMPQFLLAGTFIPVEVFPNWLQPVSAALPLTYLNDAFRKVAFEGAGLWQVWPQIGILLLFGVVFYAIAVRVFRWE